MSVQTEPDPIEEQERELHGQMSFLDHLEELRRRIIHMLIAVAIAFGACWTFAIPLFNIVQRPVQKALGNQQLVFLTITEPFNLQLKIALAAAIFLASPFIMAQVWLFVAPGLYKRERRYAAPFIISSSLLFVLGGVFGYFVAFPFALTYLVQYTQEMKVDVFFTISEYFDLFIAVELGLGIVFL